MPSRAHRIYQKHFEAIICGKEYNPFSNIQEDATSGRWVRIPIKGDVMKKNRRKEERHRVSKKFKIPRISTKTFKIGRTKRR